MKDASTVHILKGDPVVEALTADLKTRIERLHEAGIVPNLAIVRIGDRKDDISYAKGAIKQAKTLGIAVVEYHAPEDITQAELEQVIQHINEDPTLISCLLLRPLPHHIDEASICALLDPEKDPDGITPGSLYSVFAGQGSGYAPCTAAAVMEMLDYYDIPLTGANAVVVGRSLVVGKPLAMLLQQKNATVTMCHTKTNDPERICASADILIAAAGSLQCIGQGHTNPDQIVIDVGINWDEQAQKLKGDVDFEQVEPCVSAITPVPGGVGKVTTAVLMKHVVEAAEKAALSSAEKSGAGKKSAASSAGVAEAASKAAVPPTVVVEKR